jgi:hypothetical protein
MNRFLFPAALALAVASGIGLSGCATLSDSGQQQLEVHAILDHREVAGVGCLLENDLGRWFVVAPGRVTVTRSSQPLAVDCKHEGRGSASEWWVSRFDTDKLIGNLATTAGLGYYVDRHSGAGFSYPSTLTVSMRAPKAGAPDPGEADPGTPIF